MRIGDEKEQLNLPKFYSVSPLKRDPKAGTQQPHSEAISIPLVRGNAVFTDGVAESCQIRK
jgi:hypothetical protein